MPSPPASSPTWTIQRGLKVPYRLPYGTLLHPFSSSNQDPHGKLNTPGALKRNACPLLAGHIFRQLYGNQCIWVYLAALSWTSTFFYIYHCFHGSQSFPPLRHCYLGFNLLSVFGLRSSLYSYLPSVFFYYFQYVLFKNFLHLKILSDHLYLDSFNYCCIMIYFCHLSLYFIFHTFFSVLSAPPPPHLLLNLTLYRSSVLFIYMKFGNFLHCNGFMSLIMLISSSVSYMCRY